MTLSTSGKVAVLLGVLGSTAWGFFVGYQTGGLKEALGAGVAAFSSAVLIAGVVGMAGQRIR